MAARRNAAARSEAAPQTAPAELLARMLFLGLGEVGRADGVLARHTGPALLIDAAGQVVTSNAAGRMVADALLRGEAEAFRAAVSASIHHNTVSAEVLEVSVARQSGQVRRILEASVLPVGDMRTALVLGRDITDNIARERALEGANARERLLREILRTVRDESEAADMLSAAASSTARAFGADACLIFRGRETASFKSAAAFGAVVGTAADVAALLSRAAVAEEAMTKAGWLVAATSYHHEINGALALWRAGGEEAWSADDCRLIVSVADHLGIALAQIADHEQLRDLSRTDGLTGLLNRRSFYAELERRWPRACRAGVGALIYCDLDNFKLVNDRFGHASGDDALRRLAELMCRSTRARDLVARLGGDEFAIWLDDADAPGAARKADGLLTASMSELASLTGDSHRPLGVSLGIALPSRERRHPETLDSFLGRADAAMYAAKRDGKGRCVMADPPPEGAPS